MSKDMNLEGIPTALCPMCGCNWFTIQVVLDPETYEIAAYGTEAECYGCKVKLTLGTPADLKNDEEE